MRGRLTLKIRRRIFTPKRDYNSKWKIEDQLMLESVQNNSGKVMFKVSSKKNSKSFLISRDEKAFVKIIYIYYKEGDYSILLWGKGKKKGLKNFWDGVIIGDKRFMRRRTIKKSLIGNYMRTKKIEQWHSL